MVEKLVLAIEGSFETGNIDLYTILSTYNFGFWFNGYRGYVVVDEGIPVVAEVYVDGRYRIYSPENRSCSECLERLSWILGLEEDLGDFHRRGSSDPLLGSFIRKYSGWRLRTTSLWWALVTGICQQNASFRQGWRMLYNIIKLYGRRASIGDVDVLLPPTPRDILDNKSLLVNAGTGYRGETIYRVAKAFTEGTIDQGSIAKLSSKRIEEELKRIKGVGSYTARLAMTLALRKYDLPPIDRWVARIVEEAYGVSSKDAEGEWRRRWGRWGGLAVIALTITLDAKPLSKALERIRNKQLLPVENGEPTPLNLWRYYS